MGVAQSAEWAPDAPAEEATKGADVWFVVADPYAVPMTAAGTAPEPGAGRLLVAGIPDLRAAHTLRELERAEQGGGSAGGRAAIGFRTADFPPQTYETVGLYIRRLLSFSPAQGGVPGFQAVSLGDPSERERVELTRRLPGGAQRILDVGCGAGVGIAGAKTRNSSWEVTGIEKDPRLASQARQRCDRVLEGDLARILPELAATGESFDAIVYADVLEHVEDPAAALALGRRLAAPGTKLLVSVPNVGHLSIVRDLVLGRFDPVPAGLTDAGHLRWFTRAFLAEALAESGWRLETIESEPGAPAPDAEEFLALAAAWPDADRESLATYQWIASARPA